MSVCSKELQFLHFIGRARSEIKSAETWTNREAFAKADEGGGMSRMAVYTAVSQSTCFHVQM